MESSVQGWTYIAPGHKPGVLFKEVEIMQKGVCKWFNAAKGFGFIMPDDGGSDVFVHYSVIEMKGYQQLSDGQAVEFEAKSGPKGLQATRVVPLS